MERHRSRLVGMDLVEPVVPAEPARPMVSARGRTTFADERTKRRGGQDPLRCRCPRPSGTRLAARIAPVRAYRPPRSSRRLEHFASLLDSVLVLVRVAVLLHDVLRSCVVDTIDGPMRRSAKSFTTPLHPPRPRPVHTWEASCHSAVVAAFTWARSRARRGGKYPLLMCDHPTGRRDRNVGRTDAFVDQMDRTKGALVLTSHPAKAHTLCRVDHRPSRARSRLEDRPTATEQTDRFNRFARAVTLAKRPGPAAPSCWWRAMSTVCAPLARGRQCVDVPSLFTGWCGWRGSCGWSRG
mmetsp:Transcript_47682/g.132332  ORF Transcript_47682/g.132332 Transcript_47682/m.132332 type:complete len:296 (-) Transcript_47682:9-896(-)